MFSNLKWVEAVSNDEHQLHNLEQSVRMPRYYCTEYSVLLIPVRLPTSFVLGTHITFLIRGTFLTEQK